jgi:caffeoylshikimate esterase
VKPPAPVLKVLTLMANVMPKAKLFPQKDLAALAFRDLRKRKMVCPFLLSDINAFVQYVI